MVVRRATLDDASQIAAIHVRSWQAGYKGIVPDDFLQSLSVNQRTEVWREALSNPSDVWVAEEEGRLLGWIGASKSRDPDADATTAELWAIYVDPSVWRRGVGRALWGEAESHLRSARFSRVTLWVLRENTTALRFYENIGFSLDRGHEKAFERGAARLTEIRLQRDLG